MQKDFSQKTFNICILIVYTLIVLCGIYYHEICIDEAQAWLLAGEPSFLNILKESRIEGHPLLWYLILLIPNRCAFPVFSMQLLAAAFLIISTAVLIFKSPFNNLIKMFIIFSPAFLYYLPVLPRNYCLVPLFLFLFCIYYKKQTEHPVLYCLILLLLANTHILMFGFCFFAFVCFLFFSIKNKFIKYNFVNSVSVLFTAVVFLSIIIFFSGAVKSNIDIIYLNSLDINLSNLAFFFDIFKPYKAIGANILYFFAESSFIIFVISLLALTFKTDRQFFLIALCGLLFQFFVYIFIWQINPQKMSLVILIFIACSWRIFSEQFKSNNLFLSVFSVSMLIFFAFNIPLSFKLLKYDIQNDVSYSLKTAKVLKSLTNKDSIVMAVGYTSPVQVYLPNIKYYSPLSEQIQTYYKYDVKISGINITNQKKQDHYNNDYFEYILSGFTINDNRYKLIYAPEQSFPGEKFYLYRLNQK